MALPAGIDLTAEVLQDEFDAHARGIIAWGNRATGSSGATTSTGVGVLRLDDVPVIGGRAYKIWSNPMFMFSTVSGDDIGLRIRYTTDGTVPTTSSTLLPGAAMQTRIFSTSNGDALSVGLLYFPATDELLSVLLNVYRAGGTGTVTVFASATFPMNLYIEDVGLAVADTGTDV